VKVVKNVHISRASAARGVEYKQRRVTLILYQNYPSFMAPQTEIPLTGEMSRSDKRVTARCEQLEPVTLNMLSATAVASLYRYDKTIHRIVLSATDNSRVPLLQYGVAGEETVQRCRQKQKDRSMSDLFVCLYVTKIKLYKTFIIVHN
jgi:hypothetical protein